MNLSGRTVILTGAAGGIGSALALELCAEGADVLAIGRRAGALDQLRQRCAGRPGQLRPLAADITRAIDRQRIVETARSCRAPSVLVHGAACSAFGLFADSDEAERERLMQTNVLAPMALTQALLPLLLAQAAPAVVAIGSTFGSLAHPGFAAYSASKFALRGFIEALGREHADTALAAFWIAPRATATGFNSPAVDALNAQLGTRVDSAETAAAGILQALKHDRHRRQLGFPEKLFAWLNSAFPALIDRGLRGALPVVRAHAAAARAAMASPTEAAAVLRAPPAPRNPTRPQGATS